MQDDANVLGGDTKRLSVIELGTFMGAYESKKAHECAAKMIAFNESRCVASCCFSSRHLL